MHCSEGRRRTANEATGGEGGIRTPDTVARMPHFECGAFNHSATSPIGSARICNTKSVGNQQKALPGMYWSQLSENHRIRRPGDMSRPLSTGLPAPSFPLCENTPLPASAG